MFRAPPGARARPPGARALPCPVAVRGVQAQQPGGGGGGQEAEAAPELGGQKSSAGVGAAGAGEEKGKTPRGARDGPSTE